MNGTRKTVRTREAIAIIDQLQAKGMSWDQISGTLYEMGYRWLSPRSLSGMALKLRREFSLEIRRNAAKGEKP